MGCASPAECTLRMSEMAERIAAWRKLSTRALSREAEAGRIRSVYPADEDLLRTLDDLVAAEAECCAFLRFTVHRRPHETVVELEFPPEARALVEQVIPA